MGRMDKEAGNSWTLDELRGEFERYSRLINAADLRPAARRRIWSTQTASSDGLPGNLAH